MLYVETDSRSNREDATDAAAGGRKRNLMTLFATLAGLLHAAAARLERFDARRVELRAFRALRRRNPTVHLALLSASGGDERDAADSWTQVLAEPAEPKR
ncbi:MAG TPA: hypothetical protein VH142_12205, partial [Polyangiaceae bacterium]|nr:hypothetical protein [Polyangiaceae bacterium]